MAHTTNCSLLGFWTCTVRWRQPWYMQALSLLFVVCHLCHFYFCTLKFLSGVYVCSCRHRSKKSTADSLWLVVYAVLHALCVAGKFYMVWLCELKSKTARLKEWSIMSRVVRFDLNGPRFSFESSECSSYCSTGAVRHSWNCFWLRKYTIAHVSHCTSLRWHHISNCGRSVLPIWIRHKWQQATKDYFSLLLAISTTRSETSSHHFLSVIYIFCRRNFFAPTRITLTGVDCSWQCPIHNWQINGLLQNASHLTNYITEDSKVFQESILGTEGKNICKSKLEIP